MRGLVNRLNQRLFRLFAAAALFGTTAFSQTASITGVITDPKGGAVPEAAITVRNIDTGVENEAPTNGVGYYTFPQLNPGNYELTVRKTGFRAATRPPFKLDVGQIARVDVSLTIGNVEQSITVNAEAPIVSSQKATVEQVIGSQKIVDLPLNGRDFTQLATLVPGAGFQDLYDHLNGHTPPLAMAFAEITLAF